MKKKNHLLVLFLIFTPLWTLGQNYCIGDNDPPSLFNPSFEMNSCCPNNFSTTGNSMLDCTPGWSQASLATSDYYNDNCSNGFLDQISINASDGAGFVGIIVSPGYNEYIGTALVEPFIAGGQYSLTLDVTYQNVWQDCTSGSCNTQWLNNSWGDIPVTLFGSVNAGNLPWQNYACPVGSGFVELGSVSYSPSNNWETVTITFSPDETINAIAIGGPCGTVPGYESIGDFDAPNLYIDNLVLNVEAPPTFSMSQSGDPCSDDLSIEINNPSSVGGTYNWYINGSPLNGEEASSVDLNGYNTAVGDVIGVAFYAETGYCVEGELEVMNLSMPNANFSSSITCEGQSMQFSDLSSVPQGSIIDWEWEFSNDNGTSSAQNPVCFFAQPGEYSINLTVTSEAGCSSSITEDVVIHPNPSVTFDPLLVCVNVENEFDDLSFADGQAIAEVIWNFGDGSEEESGLSVTHTFINGGEYSVSQTVTTNLGCSTSDSHVVYVEEIPFVGFEWNDPCANQEQAYFVNETDPGIAEIDYYEWQFGDGYSLTGIHAEHLYSEPQMAEVWLYAYTENGCVDSTMNVVSVKGVTAEMSFLNVCEEADVEIHNLSQGHNDGLGNTEWDFGQGLFSTTFEAFTSYHDFGNYEVQLIQYTTSGCVDTTSQSIQIYQNPVASFIHLHDSCVYQNFGFQGNSFVPESDELVEFNWQFGDGNTLNAGPDGSHTYAVSGMMEVSYSVLSALGCVHDTTMFVEVRPLPVPDFEVTPVCEYSGPSEFMYVQVETNAEIIDHYWEFGDGNVSEEISPSNQYPQYGTYDVTLTITDQFECVNQITKPAIVERVIAEFEAIERSGCPPLAVEFYDNSWSSHSQIMNYEWTTNPLSSSIIANGPVIEFSNSSDTSNQFYDVKLVTTTAYGCLDTTMASEYIEVYYAPNTAFVLEHDDDVHEVLNYIRTLNLTTSAISYVWDLGNGDQSSDENVEWYYEEHGEYLVSLTAFSPNGCPRTVSEVISIKPGNQLYVPNAFTPNTDGVNERFGPVIYGDEIMRYEFAIYNRWGNLVFQTDNPEMWWDGASRNDGDFYSQNEVFVYQIIVQFKNDPVTQHHRGHVTLIR